MQQWMRKLWIGSLLWMLPWSLSAHFLQKEEMPKVMERFFSLHIEQKEWSPALVRRALKVYVEQFDPEKIYLLESEAISYTKLSDAEVGAIVQRLRNAEYRDFEALNRVFQAAIRRSQAIRNLAKERWSREGVPEKIEGGGGMLYAHSVEELAKRQEMRMVRFYAFHQARSQLAGHERVTKLFQLLERKLQRWERQYLWLDPQGNSLTSEHAEHLFVLHLLKSFAKSLDTHTSFFSAEEAREMRVGLEKQFEGVGVVLAEGIDGVMIAELIPGSPAAESGRLQVNDLLVEIDGMALEHVSFEEVLNLLKTRRGKVLSLGIRRSGVAEVLRTTLEKRPIAMDQERIETSFTPFGKGGIGKIILHSFYENEEGVSSERDIKEAIHKFRQQGELYGLVLDLRENSGGFLSQAVKVAGLFISNGVVVISKYGKDEIHYLRSISGRSFFHGPLVILTSKMSASASEIVAQTLQDYGVALVVGDETTFGKGSIQYQTVTDEKADLFFKVTVGKYYTVSGKSTQIRGVEADIVVPSQYAPYKIGERFLEHPLSVDQVNSAFIDPLTDLDEKVRRVFREKYLPYLQRVVPFWRRMLPTLKERSRQRVAHHPGFQALLEHQAKVKARQNPAFVNAVDEPLSPATFHDLQMEEAVRIVQDMLQLEAEIHATSVREFDLSCLGSPFLMKKGLSMYPAYTPA